MPSKQVNTINVSIGSGAQVTLPEAEINFDPGRKCNRIRARATVTFANSSTAYNMTSANCVTVLSAIVTNWYLAWGLQEEDSVDPTQIFALMRLLYANLELNDFLVNNVALNAVSGSTIQIAASGSSTTLTFEFLRSFIVKKFGMKKFSFCPGYSQMKQIRLGITPSGNAAPTFNGGDVTISNSSAIPIQFIFEHVDSNGENTWASVPIIREASPSAGGQRLSVPIGDGGCVISVFDRSSAAASYGLTLFDLDPGEGKLPIQGIVQFSQAYAAYVEDLSPNQFDWSTLASPLLWLQSDVEPDLMENTSKLDFYQPANDITAPLIDVVYIPVQTASKVSNASANLLSGTGTRSGFKLGVKQGIATKTDAKVSSVAPLTVTTPAQPDYDTTPGTYFKPGAAPVIHVPNPVLHAAASAAQAQDGGVTGSAGTSQLSKSATALAAHIPGASAPGPKGTTSGTTGVVAVSRMIAGKVASPANASKAAKKVAQKPSLKTA